MVSQALSESEHPGIHFFLFFFTPRPGHLVYLIQIGFPGQPVPQR